MIDDEKEIIGVGALLKTKEGRYLFQKRDMHARVNPGKIAPFGGGKARGEDFYSALERELREELNIGISNLEIKEIGDFRSHAYKDKYIKLFLIEDIDTRRMELREGEKIVKCSLKETLNNPEVTDFTKEVIRFFLEKKN